MFNKKMRLVKKRDLLVKEIEELRDRVNDMVKKDVPFKDIKPVLDREVILTIRLQKVTKEIIKMNNIELNKFIKKFKKKILEVL